MVLAAAAGNGQAAAKPKGLLGSFMSSIAMRVVGKQVRRSLKWHHFRGGGQAGGASPAQVTATGKPKFQVRVHRQPGGKADWFVVGLCQPDTDKHKTLASCDMG